MKNFITTSCAIVIGASVSAAPIDLSDTYSSFVAFGDSLSDDGKFVGTPFEPGLPTVGGRFTNGDTFAQDVASDFGVSFNFALGGATARAENETPLPPIFSSFDGQVSTFVASLSFPGLQDSLGDNPLFSVLFGANDILQNIGLPNDFDFEPGIGALAANAVEANIRAINAISSSFDDFVVMNLPDLSQTPLFQNAAFGAGALAPAAQAETIGFNAQLASNINALKDDGINIITLDLNALFQQNLAAASLLGVDTNTPCSFDLSNPGPENTCVFSPGSPDNVDPSLASNFFFIDSIHPNADVHGALAGEFRAAAAPNVVPVPASLPLLIAGFGVFGIVRSRQPA